MKRIIFLSLSILALISCKSYPKGPIEPSKTAQTIDYSKLMHWASHPEKSDMADLVPGGGVLEDQPSEEVDVFFIHPTTYTTYKGDLNWNADINDEDLNELTDASTIRYQASAFNQSGRVYAPRYRQAHIEAFYTDDRILGEKALDFAYNDVKTAFQYYLENENQGRPIIIAAHSQGTRHAKILLAEFFDGTDLLEQLVAAYIIGIPVLEDQFANIPPCQAEDDLQCFLSWRTFKHGHVPDDFPIGESIAVINPISWETSGEMAPKTENKGGVLRDFDRIYPNLVEAQIYDGILWSSKPKFPFSFLFTRKNYHVIDINLFYLNIRENAVKRTQVYMSQ